MKNNLKSTVLILCGVALFLISSSIGFFVANDKMSKDKEIENKQEEVINSPKAYTVSLTDPENFSVVTESYNDDNNLNLIITSKSIYSYLVADIWAYDSTGKLSNEFSYNFNFVGNGDSILINLSVDADIVDSIVVDVSNVKQDEELIVYDRKLLDFSTDVNDSNLELVSENKLNSDLLSVKGYITFYKGDTLVDTLPFNIENVSNENKISTSIANTTKEYDKVKVHINEIL